MTREEIINEIKRLFDKDKGNTLNKVLKENKEMDDFLQEMINNEPWFENKRRAFSCVARGVFHKVICPTCKHEVPLMKAIYGIKYCSSKCSSNSKELQEARKQTNIRKYGVENPFASEEIKQKIRQKNLENYGVDNPSKSNVVKEKIKSVMVRKYGVEVPLQNKEFRNKFKDTMMQRYGVENALQSEELKQHAVETNQQKYGCNWAFQSKEFKEKSKQTCLERYGVENASQSVEIKNRVKQTCLERYGGSPSQNKLIREKQKATNFERYGVEENAKCPELIAKRIRTVMNDTYERIQRDLSEYVIPLFTKEDYIGINRKIEYKWKCVKCGTIFKSCLASVSIIPRCPKCNEIYSSHEEKDISELISNNYNGKIILHDRHILPSGKEIDIYIPDKKVAIEYNGLYWHSVEKGKDKEYHISKSIECENLGIHLIHVFGNEWNKNKEQISSFILDAIQFDDKSMLFQKHLELCKQDKDNICVSRNYFNSNILIESGCKILKIIEPMPYTFRIKTSNNAEGMDEKNNYMTFYDCGGFVIEPPHPPMEQIWSLN